MFSKALTPEGTLRENERQSGMHIFFTISLQAIGSKIIYETNY